MAGLGDRRRTGWHRGISRHHDPRLYHPRQRPRGPAGDRTVRPAALPGGEGHGGARGALCDGRDPGDGDRSLRAALRRRLLRRLRDRPHLAGRCVVADLALYRRARRRSGGRRRDPLAIDRISLMEYVTLGRTGLRVSVAGLGCGGFSRLGLGTGKSEAEAVALVHQAFDLGVNLFDTAAVYGTEAVLGKALRSLPRDQVVVATKAWLPRSAGRSAAERAVASLDNSLKLLGIDCVDIFELHGVSPGAY